MAGKKLLLGTRAKARGGGGPEDPPPQGRTEVAGSVEGEQGKGVQSKEAAGL